MEDKAMMEEELQKLIDIRESFLDFLDTNIPKKENGLFDFSTDPTLDAKAVYEHFFKLDYQARKLRGFLVQSLNEKP